MQNSGRCQAVATVSDYPSGVAGQVKGDDEVVGVELTENRFGHHASVAVIGTVAHSSSTHVTT